MCLTKFNSKWQQMDWIRRVLDRSIWGRDLKSQFLKLKDDQFAFDWSIQIYWLNEKPKLWSCMDERRWWWKMVGETHTSARKW